MKWLGNQSFITSLLSHPSSCVPQHTKDVLKKQVLPRIIQTPSLKKDDSFVVTQVHTSYKRNKFLTTEFKKIKMCLDSVLFPAFFVTSDTKRCIAGRVWYLDFFFKFKSDYFFYFTYLFPLLTLLLLNHKNCNTQLLYFVAILKQSGPGVDWFFLW